MSRRERPTIQIRRLSVYVVICFDAAREKRADSCILPKATSTNYRHFSLTSDRVCPRRRDGMAPEADGAPHNESSVAAATTLLGSAAAERTISQPALTRANPRYAISAPRWS
jgi:hypothetical protein